MCETILYRFTVVLQLLSEFMAVVEQAFLDLSTHGHTPAGPTNKLSLIQQADSINEQNSGFKIML
ncbi:hypothetical protein [Spartinivicinus ruber]|uniref:hypothetical protein n=1 Tax=Spartinivicinus ruber TaxID=2683272 RepID=UPI0013D81FAE|nr:hypothetical protein [Spartinivicinus ruber]